ncbi:MAG: alpha/beta hydrolase [Actinomycetota bacterium]|nr:alpha/beta hydrolase [Actinomycetota bacterium]
MELEPRLIDVATPRDAVGTVLVLHGGASRGEQMMVSPTQLSVLRMIPIARRIARSGRGRLEVYRLLNSRRGWDAHHTPVNDVRWALGQLAARAGGSHPTCLVGHSLGGRAALFAADQEEVVSAVALAPWVSAMDMPRGLAGRQILIVHGSGDRIASPQRSAALARRISGTARVSYVSVEGGRHAMLKSHAEFSGPAARFAVETLAQRERALNVT